MRKNVSLIPYAHFANRARELGLVWHIEANELGAIGIVAPNEFLIEFGKFSLSKTWPLFTKEEALNTKNESIKKVKRLIVIDFENELELLDLIKKTWPFKFCVSYHYEFVRVIKLGFPIYGNYKTRKVTECKYVLFSLPGADAEYLSQCMEMAGLPAAYETLIPLHAEYADIASSFSLRRVLYNNCRRLGEKGPFGLHLQADTLSAFWNKKQMSQSFFRDVSKAREIKFIYFTRRDKILQAGIMSLLSGTKYRSSFELHKERGLSGVISSLEAKIPYDVLDMLVKQEAALEEWLEPFKGQVKMITLESLVSNPRDVLEDIAKFLAVPLNKDATIPNYRTVYKNIPKLIDKARDFRRDVIDRLGLHANAEGSLVSPEDHLYE